VRPEVAVGGVVVRAGHDGRPVDLLLVERGRGPAVGRWSVPGGRVEPGERAADAVVREVAEETGLAVRVEGFLGWVERIDPAGGWHHVILDFRARALDEAAVPVAGDDAAAVRWCPVADLAGVDFVDGLLDFLVEHGIAGPTASPSGGTARRASP
jgi:ADP-ribose pyrophosphatase YjhB (NUDIX family)